MAQGKPLDKVLEEMSMVVEGVKTTKAAHALAAKYGVTMPITAELHRVLFEDKDAEEAVRDLMSRVRTHELEEIASPDTRKWMS